MSTVVAIRDAATVVLLRDAQDLEVLLLRRAGGHVFGANAHVFPGGAVDGADDDAALAARCLSGRDYAQARLGHTGRALAYWMAAIREGFEEAGVLVGCQFDRGADPEQRTAEREALNTARCGWRDVVERLDLRFKLDDLVYFAFWQTPRGAPRRYATRFFATRAPAEQIITCDGHETDLAWWARPHTALECHARGEIKLMRPTQATLQTLCEYSDVDSALAGLADSSAVQP